MSNTLQPGDPLFRIVVTAQDIDGVIHQSVYILPLGTDYRNEKPIGSFNQQFVVHGHWEESWIGSWPGYSRCKSLTRAMTEVDTNGHSVSPTEVCSKIKELASQAMKKMFYPGLAHSQSNFIAVTGTMNVPFPKAHEELEKAAMQLPGVKAFVSVPCDCGPEFVDELSAVVVHLNDREKWSRDRIADWLDDLHESGEVDLEFHSDPPKEV